MRFDEHGTLSRQAFAVARSDFCAVTVQVAYRDRVGPCSCRVASFVARLTSPRFETHWETLLAGRSSPSPGRRLPIPRQGSRSRTSTSPRPRVVDPGAEGPSPSLRSTETRSRLEVARLACRSRSGRHDNRRRVESGRVVRAWRESRRHRRVLASTETRLKPLLAVTMAGLPSPSGRDCDR